MDEMKKTKVTMRHMKDRMIAITAAETKYNEACMDHSYKGNPYIEYQFIDSPLSGCGREFCKKVSETIGEVLPNVKIVLLSPLERAL